MTSVRTAIEKSVHVAMEGLVREDDALTDKVRFSRYRHTMHCVMTNRSIKAYRANPGILVGDMGVDDWMEQFELWSDHHRTILHIGGLHCTCIGADVPIVHPDHKGIASAYVEQNTQCPVDVALFCQGCAGDLAPSDTMLGDTDGAVIVGRLQALECLEHLYDHVPSDSQEGR